MKLPYGISHFPTMRRQGYVFVDHTTYVRRFEAFAPHVLFVRPRRFGKSLWLSILEHYYDVRFADGFGELFGGLDIGEAPTELRNQFMVLRLDFSAIDTGRDDIELEHAIGSEVRTSLRAFLTNHRSWIPDVDAAIARLADIENPVRAWNETIKQEVAQAEVPLYVLVDEYDNFANELIASRQEHRYEALVRGTGLLKTFFKAIKEATGAGIVARTFLTGVSPLLLDDLTSGFNIAANASLDRDFAGALGFTHGEFAELLDRGISELTSAERDALPEPSELEALMVSWYDGYRFHPEADALFNPDMVLFALRDTVRGRLPDMLLDTNLRTDLAKLEMVVRKAGDSGRLRQLVERDGEVVGQVQPRFGIERLTSPSNFHSLLFYLGLLTYQEGPAPQLRIPNYVARTLYWDELRTLLEETVSVDVEGELRESLRSMMQDGAGEAFFRLARERVLQRLSKRGDFAHLNEVTVKAVLLSYLTLSNELSIFSEWEMGRGYADIVVVPMPHAETYLSHAWMIELKYLSLSDDGPQARQKALDGGQRQLEGYLSDAHRMRYLRRFHLHPAVALFVGSDELVWRELRVRAPAD